MSRKRAIYTPEFKTKLVLEVLKNEKTLNEIASTHNVTPKNLQNWKKIFLDNAEIAMEPSKAVKEYKEELAQVSQENIMLTKIVGKMTVEKEWLEKKLVSLGLSERKQMIEPKLKTLSISKQCSLLQINRSHLYYTAVKNPEKEAIKEEIQNIYKDLSIYGSNKVHQQLLEFTTPIV